MIEATCGACGTVNRIAENDVPVGAKFVACASCKSRVALPTNTRFGAGAAPRAPAGPIPSPPAGGNRGDVIDLADLPAPKRQSPLGTDPSRAAPTSGLAAAGPAQSKPARNPLDLDDLLAPAGPPAGGLPPPIPRARAAVADLPAPKGPAGGGIGPGAGGRGPTNISDLPAPKAPAGIGTTDVARGPSDISDLPAPKSPPGMADLPPTRSRPMPTIEDLPAPKASGGGISEHGAPRGPTNISDLPAPKAPAGMGPPPTPVARGSAGISDLPAPRGPAGISDLPAPRGRADISDLPAPRGPAGISDLPAPRGRADISDLPAPRGPSGVSDLPTPKGYSDLPAPKGYSDLPAPRGPAGYSDLPAPKGPAGISDLPMPKPGGVGDLPAPKGFFDDLPQPAMNRGGGPELPAPKGFFDDLPQPSQHRAPELPAPKGFFENLPANKSQPTSASAPNEPAPFSAAGLFGREVGLEPSGAHQLDLGHSGPDLDLGPAAPVSSSAGYDDLDLSKPSTGAGPRFDQQAAQNQPRQGAQPAHIGGLPPFEAQRGADMALELEEPRHQTPKLAPKKKDKAPDPQEIAARGKRQKLVLGAVLGLALAGGVGFVVYTRHAAAQERADEMSAELGKARAALVAGDATHWTRALTSAKKVQELDEADPDALGIGAEAALAGVLDDGINAAARGAQANKMINTAREAGVTSAALDRAIALAALNAGQADRAVQKLQPLAAAAPSDGFLSLYLGWAFAAKADPKAASAAFDQAMTATPATKIPGLFGRGKAKLALADLEGARADFVAVLALAKDHIGAQVGLAAAMTPSQSAQQESDLLAILARKDIEAADPRVRVQAWTLAGDDARRGGRLDAARERYRKALALATGDVPATTGLAEVELRDNKLDLANELITKAVTAAPNDVRAQLVYCELAIRQGKLDDADARIKTLAGKDPPPTPLELARLDLVKGKLLEARGDIDGAIAAWEAGGKAGGDLDLAPMMAAVAKLGQLAKDEPNPAKAAVLRARADDLLGTLGDKANGDPALALTLGSAYLEAGVPAKAEPWLKKAAEARPKDPEAKFQLAKALTRLIRPDEAIEELRSAIELDPMRADIGLELAKTFEAAGRDPDAGAQYDALLATKDPAVELRARAGRFYARTNQLPKAIAQSTEILRLDPTNAAGYYLKGEGLLQEAKLEEASRAFQSAVDADPDPQYLDAQGRAAEARATAALDTKFQELALRAYEQASKAAPAMFNPLAGQGRLWLARNEPAKAAPFLVAANKLRSDDADVMYNLGRAYEMIGGDLTMKQAAIGWLVKAVIAAPKAETWNRLAELYSTPEINQPKPAVDAWGNAIKLGAPEADSPDWLTDAYYKRGQLLGTLGDQHGEKDMYEKFIGRHPPQSARVDEAKRALATNLHDIR